jgi:hypothetical protein
VRVTAGSREVPGRKGLRQETATTTTTMMMMIILLLLLLLVLLLIIIMNGYGISAQALTPYPGDLNHYLPLKMG